ncbi:hypothetical protein GJ496_009515 [Pomphorhynchus laevis]|nr:hypothetical protein GJ496_009515 [Pomphorhynchus laevis]
MQRRKIKPIIPNRPHRPIPPKPANSEKAEQEISVKSELPCIAQKSNDTSSKSEKKEHTVSLHSDVIVKDTTEKSSSNIVERYKSDWCLRNYIKSKCIDVYRRNEKIKNQRRAKRKQYNQKFKSTEFDPTDLSQMTIRDFVYFNHPSAPKFEVQTPTVRKNENPVNEIKSDQQFNALAPKLRIADDGTIKIDEKSLVVEHQKSHFNEIVEEHGAQHFDSLNCHSYRKYTYTKRWNKSETARFYKALEIFGTDFGMISRLFPGRTRHEIKRKFNKEDRSNTSLIDKIIFNTSRSIDLSCFLTDYDDSPGSKKSKRRSRKGSKSILPGSDDEDVTIEVNSNYGGVRLSSLGSSSRKLRRLSRSSLLNEVRSNTSSSEQEAVLESITRLLEGSRRNGQGTASPLVFVANSTPSASSSENGNNQMRSEIAIHVLTSDAAFNEIQLQPDPDTSNQFSEIQVRQYFGDSESTESSHRTGS